MNVKKIFIILLILTILVPTSMATTQTPQEYGNEDNNEERETSINHVESLEDQSDRASVIKACEINPQETKFRRERYDLRPLESERTRYERDIWMKDVEIKTTPYKFDHTIYETDDQYIYFCDCFGIKGQDITFTVTFQNNGSAGDVEIRLEIMPYLVHQDDGYDDDNWPVYWFEYKQVSSQGAGAEETVDFTWTVECSRLLIVNASAFERGDPDPDNNEIWWLGRSLSTYDPGDNEAGSPLENEKGNWHTRDVVNDPAADDHSDPKAWYHGNANGMSYGADNNTLALKDPVIFDGDSIYDTRFGTYLTFTIAGNLDATSELALYYSLDGGGWEKMFWWTTPWNTNADWFWATFSSGDTYYPGIPMNYADSIKIAINVDSPSGGGVRPGLYIDEFQIYGMENGTIENPPDDPSFTKLKIENRDPGQIKDSNSNGVIDAEGDPGQEMVFPLKLTNDGTAIISKITFEVSDLPNGWDAEDIIFEPASVTAQMARYETKDIDVKVTIPDDARASVDFSKDSGDKDMEYNPHIINITATATGIPPEVGKPDPIPDEDSKSIDLEAIVTEQPALEVSVVNDNITGKQGIELDYFMTIKNKGNCNLTDNINAKVMIRELITPSNLWTVQLSDNDFKLDYGDELDVTVTIVSPQNVIAGYHITELEISIEEFGISESIILIIGIEQVFGIELDLKDKNDENIEIDPEKIGSMQQFVDFEITNTGNGDDSVKMVAEAGNSNDDKWFDIKDEAAIELGPTGGLDDNEDFSMEFNVPEDAVAGKHEFTIKAVSEKDLIDGTESDEKLITFTVLRPDLLVSTKIELVPDKPVKDDETEIRVRIFNNGTTSAMGFSVYLYIDDALVEYKPVNILQKGDSTDIPSFKYFFTDDKEYTIKVTVDPTDGVNDNGNITEMDELNNDASRTVEVIAPELQFGGDMLVSTGDGVEIMPSGEDRYDVKIDETYKLGVNVLNKGKADAKVVRVNLKILYMDPMGEEIKVIDENVTLSSISAGENKAVEFSWTPDRYGTDYFLEFNVDPENKISEENENNNQLTPDENFISEPEPAVEKGFMSTTVIISIVVVIVIIGAIIAVLLVLSRRKK